MADEKISQLADATSLQATDLLVIARAGGNYKLTGTELEASYPTALPPNGTAGGDLSGSYPNPKVAKITETSGPTDLTIGTINDGEYLKRSGSTLISGTPAGGTGLAVVAATSASGYALVNGTGTILTYTTPNDGNLHPVAVWSYLVAITATGGTIQDTIGGAPANTLHNAGGGGTQTRVGIAQMAILPPNTTVTVTQSSALTAGSATLYAAILSI